MEGKTTPRRTIDWQPRLRAKKSPKFEELYPAQEAALNSYSSSYMSEPNVAIELPTGSGKTLIALMILDYWMEQKKRTAVLCGTKNLARQFKEEADALGIPTVLFEGKKTKWAASDKLKYTKCQTITILNYWGYINQAPGLEPADVLVLDDAHLAESAAHGLFSMDVNRIEHENLYKELIDALADRFPHYSTITDFQQGNQSPLSPTELINFTDWLDIVPKFLSIMTDSDECKNGGDLFFEWGRIRPTLRNALCFVGPNVITVRPGAYPLFTDKHISKPQQRIMLSATIGSADDLSRRIGVPRIKSVPIEPRYRLAVPGKRLLILPDNESRESDMETLAIETAVKLKRSVWLCGSSLEAQLWCGKLAEFLNIKGISNQPLFVAKAQAEEIDQFVEAPTGHLFTAARYDGMDFEGDICRLVVMPSLPYACGPFERFISENLADAAFLNARVLQRMKQALGRATRNDYDYAIYIFLKNSISQYLTGSESFGVLPSNVQDEISFGVDVSSRPLDEIVKICNGFLRGKLGEIGFPQAAATYPSAQAVDVTDLADRELEFWKKLFIVHSYDQAAVDAEAVSSALESGNQAGYALFWRYLKAQASYLRHHVDNDLVGLANAKSEITKILDEPRQSAWFSRLNRLRQTLNLETVPEDADSDEFECITASWNYLLNGDLRNIRKHDEFFNVLLRNLQGNDHKAFCHAMRNLLRLIGWEAEIRDNEQGETDVIAYTGVGGKHYLLVIEGKPEMEIGKPIPLRYVNQASGQLTRYRSDHQFSKYAIAALFISKADEIDTVAQPSATQLTFIRQAALKPVAELAIAAFQRYAVIRSRKGLLPKRSECIEPLQMTPKLLCLFEICSEKGIIIDDAKAHAAAKRPS